MEPIFFPKPTSNTTRLFRSFKWMPRLAREKVGEICKRPDPIATFRVEGSRQAVGFSGL
jgi:hypothetical protein